MLSGGGGGGGLKLFGAFWNTFMFIKCVSAVVMLSKSTNVLCIKKLSVILGTGCDPAETNSKHFNLDTIYTTILK